MAYTIHTHKGMGAYAHAETLDEALAVAAQSTRETGHRASIISDDASDGISGEIMCHDVGTRVAPKYVPYSPEEYAEIRSIRAEQAEIARKDAEDEAATRKAMLAGEA